MKPAVRFWILMMILNGAFPSWNSLPVRAEAPFKLGLFNEKDYSAKGAVVSLHFAGGVLQAGTLDGNVTAWTMPPVKRGTPVTSFDQYPSDGLAVLAIAGANRDAISGGFSSVPKITHLPGAIGFNFHKSMTNGIAVAPHPASRRIALLRANGIAVQEADPETAPIVLSGKFKMLTWIDNSSTDGTTVWLAAYSPDDAAVKIWSASNWNAKPLSVLMPPTWLAAADDDPQRIELTCISHVNLNQTFKVGDAEGNLRVCAATIGSKNESPPAADQSIFSRDGSRQIYHNQDKLVLRQPFAMVDKSSDARIDTPTVLGHRMADGKNVVAVGWPKKDGRFEVELHDFVNPKRLLTPHVDPQDAVSALDIRPDASQVAGAVKGQGIVFFATPVPAGAAPAPAAVPAAIAEDDAMLDVRYTPDGKWLFTVGKCISVYDPIKRALLVKSNPLALPDPAEVVTACDYLTGPSAGDGTSQPCTLLLGTSKGRLQMLKLTVVLGAASKIDVELLAQATAAQEKIAGIACAPLRAVVRSPTEMVVWQVAPDQPSGKQLIPLEVIFSDDSASAATFFGKDQVIYRTATTQSMRSLSVTNLLACGNKRLQTLADNDSDLLVLADDAGQMQWIRGAQAPQPLSNSGKITALCVRPNGSPDHQTMIAAIPVDDTHSLLRQWSFDSGAFKAPRDFLSGSPSISAVFLAEDKNLYVGEQDGSLIRLDPAAADPGATVVSFVPAKTGVLSLAWLAPIPTSGAASPASQSGLLLVLDRNDVLTSRVTSRQGPGAGLQTERHDSPWYGAALSQDGRSLALVNGEGDVWTAAWPFPIPYQLLAHQPPLAFSHRKASESPLYAVAWSAHFDAKPKQPALFAAGADGKLYQRVVDHWQPTGPINPGQSIFAASAHPGQSIIALGHGPLGSGAGGGDECLSLWDKSLEPSAARFWKGHRSSVPAVAFSSDGATLASVDDSGLLIVWDCSHLDQSVTQPENRSWDLKKDARPMCLEWLDAGWPRHLAIGCTDGYVRIVKVEKIP